MVKGRFISFEFLFSAPIVFWLTISVIHTFDECALTSGFEGTDHCCVPRKKRKWKERRKTERNYGNTRNDLFHQYTKLKWCCRSEISSLFTDNVNTLYKKWNVTSPKIKNDKMIEIIIGIKYYRLSGSFLFNSLSRTCLLFLILATDNTDRFFGKMNWSILWPS